jgi:excisionase family DNA binding protein
MNKAPVAPRTTVDPLLTDDEAARLLGTSVNTLANWRVTGRYPLPFVKVGRLVRYRPSDIAKFISDNLTHGL